MTPEGKVKEQVKKLLKRFGIYYHMPVQNGMGSPTLDFVICVWGFYMTIETKAPGKKPTPRQEVTMGEVRASGGFVFAVSDEDSLAVVEAYLELMQSCQNKN